MGSRVRERMVYWTCVSVASGSREEHTVLEGARERADCPVLPGQKFQSETLPCAITSSDLKRNNGERTIKHETSRYWRRLWRVQTRYKSEYGHAGVKETYEIGHNLSIWN